MVAGVPPEQLPWVVDAIIEYLGLGPHRKKSAAKLSGGAQRSPRAPPRLVWPYGLMAVSWE